MTSPLEELLEAAASDPEGVVQPTYDFVGSLCYRTKGEGDRQAGLKTLLEQLYLSIKEEDYQATSSLTQVLTDWITLEHGVPRKVRAALARIYYDLALAPGMDEYSATEFSNMVSILTTNVKGERCIEQGKDLTLDWRPLFERIKFNHLHTDKIFFSPSCLDQLARVARHFFDPAAREAVFEKVLPYFDTTDPESAVAAIRVAVLVSPTTPAPESSSKCQPSSLIPIHWYLFAKLSRSLPATLLSVDSFSLIAERYLECGHIAFGAYGVFDHIQSREIFAIISRLTLIDDKNTDDSFDGPLLQSSDREVAAQPAAGWIVFSLSPACLRQENSMLSGLEGFIASIGILYHPNSTVQPRLGFVTELLYQLARKFCWRYNKEQSGQLATPPERRLNNELRQKFVRLLRDPVLLGCFSKDVEVRIGCWLTTKLLADLEPGLVVPTALQRFYASQDSQVDGESASFSMWLLSVLCRPLTREKGLRCHLPTLMNLALLGINASRPDLTEASCLFIRSVACGLPPPHLRFAESGDFEGHTEIDAETWIRSEIEKLDDEGSVVDMDYHTKLSDDEEVALFRCAFRTTEDFALRFLEHVFQFVSEAFRHQFNTDGNTRQERAQTAMLDAAEACLMSLSPQMLDETMLFLSQRLSSDPIPKAKGIIQSLVGYAVRANPKRGLEVFVPLLVKHIRNEIEECCSEVRLDGYDLLSVNGNLGWFVSALVGCLGRGGFELLLYKDEVLKLAQLAEQRFGPRAFGLCGILTKYMLSGWTETYLTGFVVTAAGQSGRDGQDKIAMKVSTWHLPSRKEINTSCEVFESKTIRLEQNVHALLDLHASLSGGEERVAWLRSLSGALGYLANVLCGMATLFDPSHAQAGGNSDMPSVDAVCASLRAQDFHRLLEPDNPLYTKIHDRRAAIGVLANRVHAFLLDCKGEYSDCLSGVYELYRTLVSDVGSCNVHQDMRHLRRKHQRWVAGLETAGAAPPLTPVLRVTLMDSYHADLQTFGTRHRAIGDLERMAFRDMIEGCSSPFEAVRDVAQNLFWCSIQQLAGSAEFLMPLMLANLRFLTRNKACQEIEGVLEIFVGSMLWWGRHCISHVPNLLQVLTEIAALDGPHMPGIVRQAKKCIKEIGIPDYRGRHIFPEGTVADAIRPADKFSNAARRESRYEIKATVQKRNQELGIRILQSKTDNLNLCALSIRALIRVGFDKDVPLLVEHISFLATNAVAEGLGLRTQCVDQFRRLIRDFLAGIRFNHNFEDFIRTQGAGGCDQVLIVPGRDVVDTEQYLTGFELGSNDDDLHGDGGKDDYFVDPSFHGSLVWPAEFYARHRHVEPPHDLEIISMAELIGSCFTKEWFQKFLSHLEREEQPLEEGEDDAKPKIQRANVDLLTYAFQLMGMGTTAAKLEEVEVLVMKVLGDGTNMGQHLATATLLLGLMHSPTSQAFRNRVLITVNPLLTDIIKNRMTRFSETWTDFLRWLARNHDPRRFPGLIRVIRSLRLNASDSDTQSHAKLSMLNNLLVDVAWRFRHRKDVASMLLQTKNAILSVDVSGALGSTLAQVYTTGFHDSWPDVRTLISANQNASSLGIRPYILHDDMRHTVAQLFRTISTFRKMNPIPYQEYHCASIAALEFVFGILRTNAAESLIPMTLQIHEELFSMLDAHLIEETNLKKLATLALEKLCRLPFREDEHVAFWEAVLGKAKSESFFHRSAAMSMIRVLYLRRLSISDIDEQKMALKMVCDMIEDSDRRIQIDAEVTLKDLLSRSRLSVMKPIVKDLVKSSQMTLLDPEARMAKSDAARLAAVRRLSATVGAYPQLTVPPDWMVEAMRRITQEISIGSGFVANIAVKAVRDFKETRRTHWEILKKVRRWSYAV
ncbi:hypothetical protein JX266_013777 [Neoarthrinium moseri]|nr:hypothetical protein JX266_013777 [Neoarthrinium moseri]